MTETLEQIAMRVWNEEYPCSKTPEFPIEFTKRLVEALNAQEPIGWTHSCPVLCLDGVELWIDRCPHCGKPASAPKLG